MTTERKAPALPLKLVNRLFETQCHANGLTWLTFHWDEHFLCYCVTVTVDNARTMRVHQHGEIDLMYILNVFLHYSCPSKTCLAFTNAVFGLRHLQLLKFHKKHKTRKKVRRMSNVYKVLLSHCFIM